MTRVSLGGRDSSRKADNIQLGEVEFVGRLLMLHTIGDEEMLPYP